MTEPRVDPVLHSKQRDHVATVVENALVASFTIRRVTDVDFLVQFAGAGERPASSIRVSVRKA